MNFNKIFFKDLTNKKYDYLAILIPVVFYFITAAKVPGWLDATLIVKNVHELTLGSWVNYHNLFHIIGNVWLKFFYGTNYTYYLSLLSGLFGALSVYGIYRCGILLTNNKRTSFISSIILMFSHSLWWHSTIVEVYTLNSFLMVLILYCFISFTKTKNKKDLFLAVFIWGLGCSNHVLMALFVLAFLSMLFFKSMRKALFNKKDILIIFLCFFLGSSIFWALLIRDSIKDIKYYELVNKKQSDFFNSTEIIKERFHNATGGGFKKYMFTKNMSFKTKAFWRLNYGILFFYNFLISGSIFFLIGLYVLFKSKNNIFKVFYFICFVTYLIWSSNYFIWDMYAFSLPVYVLSSVPIILGLDFVMKTKNKIIISSLLILILLPFFIYPNVYKFSKNSVVKNYFDNYPEIEQQANLWDPVRYVTNPNKMFFNETVKFTDSVFSILDKEARVWTSKGNYLLKYYYQDLLKEREDIYYYFVFGPFITEKKAKIHAQSIQLCLEYNLPVYVFSDLFPERWIFDYLVKINNPDLTLEDIRAYSFENIIINLPEIFIERKYLNKDKTKWIYKLNNMEKSL